jgi:hypothetical protein
MEGRPETRRFTARLPCWMSVRIDCPRLILRNRSCFPAQPPSLGVGEIRMRSATVHSSLPFLSTQSRPVRQSSERGAGTPGRPDSFQPAAAGTGSSLSFRATSRMNTLAEGPAILPIVSPRQQRQMGPKRQADLARAVRKEIATFARKLARDHRALFASDPALRKRAGQFLTAPVLPDKQTNNRDVVIAAVGLTSQVGIQYQGRKGAGPRGVSLQMLRAAEFEGAGLTESIGL